MRAASADSGVPLRTKVPANVLIAGFFVPIVLSMISPTLSAGKGFTLIELMIVVAVIGILAAIAVPNFMAYKHKSRVAAGLMTSESIRGSVAGFAAVSPGSRFPLQAELGTWADLVEIGNGNGATLKETEAQQGMAFISYATWDTDGNGEVGDDYYFVFRLTDVPNTLTGSQIEVRPSGILRQTHA